MEAQMHRPHHHEEQDPQHATGLHSVMEGEGEHDQHHEKKSVLKKVKDKAKKIKNTITKHGHGHEHEHGQEHEYRHDQMCEEEEEDEEEEEEEMVKDPEVHGAPMYESAVITGTQLPMQTKLPMTGAGLEKPSIGVHEDRYDPSNVRTGMFPNVHEEEMARPKTWPELGKLPAEGREHEHKNLPRSHDPYEREQGINVGEPRVKIGPLSGLEEDPHSPQHIPVSNYESKVTDPTGEGGREADVAPLVHRLDKLSVHDEPKSKHETAPKTYTGSHDQFAPQPTSEKPDLGLKTFDQDNPESMPSNTITGKITSATSAIADKAVSAKNVVASKLGYTGQPQEGEGKMKKPLSESAIEYGHIVAEKLTPVYGTVTGAGTAVLSKVKGGGEVPPKGADKGLSVTEYIAETFRPGDEDKALSEAITDVFHRKKEVVSEQGEDKTPPLGRVTESEEVKARLGTGQENKREGEDALAAGSETTSGAGVVDRLKEAVNSWLGKSTGIETAQHSIGESYVSGVGSAPTGEQEQSKADK